MLPVLVVVAAVVAVVVAAALLFESHEIPFWPRMPLQQAKVPHEQEEAASTSLPLSLSPCLSLSLLAALVSISAAKPVERLTVQHATSQPAQLGQVQQQQQRRQPVGSLLITYTIYLAHNEAKAANTTDL